MTEMFAALEEISTRPEPFEFYTASDLWTNEHTSSQMLSYHLNEEVDLSSRNLAFIKRSIEWITSRFGVGAGTKIADFGCGPGLYTTRLAEQQAEVTGIDFSQRSIRYAKNEASSRGLSIQYLNQNYLECEIDDRFDLILMIMCDFCALSPSQRRHLLHKFERLLKSDGHLLLGAEAWRESLLSGLVHVELTLVIGQYAQKWHLPNTHRNLTETVRAWREYGPDVVPLPHPSPRNNIWLKKNPWFADSLLPSLQKQVQAALQS